jgi:hypothetical protein
VTGRLIGSVVSGTGCPEVFSIGQDLIKGLEIRIKPPEASGTESAINVLEPSPQSWVPVHDQVPRRDPRMLM